MKTQLNLLPRYIDEQQKTKTFIIYVATLQVATFLMCFALFLAVSTYIKSQQRTRSTQPPLSTLQQQATELSAALTHLQAKHHTLSTLLVPYHTGASSVDFFAALSAQLHPALTLESLNYHNRTLTLSISTYDGSLLPTFVDALSSVPFFERPAVTGIKTATSPDDKYVFSLEVALISL